MVALLTCKKKKKKGNVKLKFTRKGIDGEVYSCDNNGFRQGIIINYLIKKKKDIILMAAEERRLLDHVKYACPPQFVSHPFLSLYHQLDAQGESTFL